MEVNKARLLINGLAVVSLLVSLFIKNDLVSMILILLSLIAALVILYRNLAKLSNVSAENPKLRTVRLVTIFNILFVLTVIVFAVLIEKGIIPVTERQSKYLLSVVLAVLMAGFGNIAPKLPFNRYTGLRLPWTVRDEETWIVAHRILGYISLPMGLLCLAGATMHTPFDIWIKLWFLGPLLLWIGIPGVLSGIFYYKKWSGRL